MDYCRYAIFRQKKCAISQASKLRACIGLDKLIVLATIFFPMLAGCQSMFVETSPNQRHGRVSVEDLARNSIDDANRQVRSNTAAQIAATKQQTSLAARRRQNSPSNQHAGKKPTQAVAAVGIKKSVQAKLEQQVRQVQYQEEIYQPQPQLNPSYSVPTEQASSLLALPTTPVSDEFIETDAVEAIQSIAAQARVTVILDENISGTVTASINNESFADAIQKICLPLGLHMRLRGNQLLISDGDPESYLFSLVAQRLSYEPLHATPDELSKLLPEQLLRYVRIANARNMLIIEAPEDIARRIYSELAQYDQPVPQVVLEAMVVVISPDSGFQFGADFGNAGINTADSNFSLDGLALTGAFPGAANQLFSRFATTSYFVRALEQQGYLSIRATPHVMAKNGEKAEISIARETFFSTLPASSQLLIRPNIQKVEAGITLEITPTIRGDNVLMVIDRAEVSENIRSSLNDANLADPFPLINRRKVSTTVNVKDGETMVIGGLMQNQLVDRISKVPVLGSMPFFGRMFQKIDQQEEAAEVVVFISPRIVRQPSDHPYQSGQLQARFNDPTILGPTAYGTGAISARLTDPNYAPPANDIQHRPASDIAFRNQIQSSNGHILHNPQNLQPAEIILHASEPTPLLRHSQQPTIQNQSPPGVIRASTDRVRESAVEHAAVQQAGFNQPISQNLDQAPPTGGSTQTRVRRPSIQQPGSSSPRTQPDRYRSHAPNQLPDYHSGNQSKIQRQSYPLSDQEDNPLRRHDDDRVGNSLR